MNEDIKKEWAEALNSGEYEQGPGVLRREKDGKAEYCCLGVLCELYLKEHNRTWDVNVFNGVSRLDDEEHYLPRAVREWAGLTMENPAVSIPGDYGEEHYHNLSDLNDIHEKSFQDIAGFIQQL